MQARPAFARAVIGRKRSRFLSKWQLCAMFLPGLVYYLIFRYMPMYGLIVSFKEYMPLDGIRLSPWAGLYYFGKLYASAEFTRVFANTLIISLYKLAYYFPVPILLSLMLNEVANMRVKKLAQTVFYLPHFLSWVVMAGIVQAMLSLDGPVNALIAALGGQKRVFLSSNGMFRTIIVITSIWKEAGWNTVIYLAAIAGVDPAMYEAAAIDGAGLVRRAIHVTLPCIRSTIIITLILRLGSVMDAGFEQILVLYNVSVYEVGDVIDTYVYRLGLGSGQISYTTAAGLFKSVIGLALIGGANLLVKRCGEEGLW